MVQCNTCGGVYEPVQADGSAYFHVCPPVAEYFNAAGEPISPLEYKAICELGGSYRVRYVDRPNKRDENPGEERDEHKRARPKAEGLGVTPIVRPPDRIEDTELVVVPVLRP